MKIAIDCRLWNETGVGRYIRNLVWELSKVDSKNEYTLFFRSNEFLTVQIPKGKFEKKLADFRWHSLQEQLEFPKLLNKFNFDLVHFPYFSVPIRYGNPYVVTIHDLILHNYPTGEASTLPKLFYEAKLLGYKYVTQKAAENAQRIIAVSESTKSEILDHLKVDSGKISVIYEGVEQVREGKAKIRTALERLESYFLYVGNMYPHKNVSLLLHAFSEITHGGAGVKMVFVGKEDYFQSKIRKLVNKLGLVDSVVFLGEVSDEELSYLYGHAWALVCPSRMEGFGLPLLEAMNSKCLVIASDIPVFKEIGAENVLYFKSGSMLELAEKMQHVIVSPQDSFKSYIIGGQKRSRAFSWEKQAKETVALYESCTRI